MANNLVMVAHLDSVVDTDKEDNLVDNVVMVDHLKKLANTDKTIKANIMIEAGKLEQVDRRMVKVISVNKMESMDYAG